LLLARFSLGTGFGEHANVLTESPFWMKAVHRFAAPFPVYTVHTLLMLPLEFDANLLARFPPRVYAAADVALPPQLRP
jgi:hypothetical protein